MSDEDDGGIESAAVLMVLAALSLLMPQGVPPGTSGTPCAARALHGTASSVGSGAGTSATSATKRVRRTAV